MLKAYKTGEKTPRSGEDKIGWHSVNKKASRFQLIPAFLKKISYGSEQICKRSKGYQPKHRDCL